jgi:hypothetical protein
LILLGLFHLSFRAEQTLFANDAPLGALTAYADVAWTFFTGAWHNLNWIGEQAPSALPNLTYAAYLLMGPVLYSKFFVPLALFLLGVGAWLFLKRSGLGMWPSLLGGIAAALNTDPFSYACWGLPSLTLCMAATFFALAALVGAPNRNSWARAVLAGFALGIGIMEGYDNGAIFSLYIAGFAMFQAWVSNGTAAPKLAKGCIRVGLVAVCAAFISAQALSTLIGTQIKGVVGTQQDAATKEQRWDEATQWSLPKIETLRVVIPGLFGYRMDTPKGGNYWGAVGQRPGVPQTRHSGSGVFAGVLVVFLAAFALAQAARDKSGPFTDAERKFIWFWAGAALVSLLLSFGRHAAFYQFIYKLPYFSTIRNPIKFMHPFTIAIVALFGYGLEALWRGYLHKNLAQPGSIGTQFKTWWQAARGFDKRWAVASIGAALASGLSYLIYNSSQRQLEQYLQSISSEQVGFPPSLVPEIAKFSIGEAAWFVLFLALAVGIVLLILSGALSGKRATWAGLLLGTVLVADLVRANLPWIIYYDYQAKYTSNSVLDQLREKPYEHRVAARLAPMAGNHLVGGQKAELFKFIVEEWLQQQYQFYRIQSLDIIQMPRMPELDDTYLREFFTPLVSVRDFTQFGSLAGKLTNQTDAVSQFLWQQLSPETRAALPQPGRAELAAPLLAGDLTRLVRTTALYEANRFAGVKISDEIKAALNQNPQGRELAHLNRALLDEAYPGELARGSQAPMFGRLWQLTSTRYIMASRNFVDLLNQQIDPINHSFRPHITFDFIPRDSALLQGIPRVEDFTTLIRPEGEFAVFEFEAALPRAKLFTQWQVATNDSAARMQLADLAFDPQKTVLLSTPAPTAPTGNQSTGSVTIAHYEPKRVALKAEAASATVLLLNDKFDPNWKVTVDGKPASLLRCNYIMRGVYLPAGAHEVEFRFDPPHGMLYVSLAAVGLGLVLCGWLGFAPKGPPLPAIEKPAPAMSAPKAKV